MGVILKQDVPFSFFLKSYKGRVVPLPLLLEDPQTSSEGKKKRGFCTYSLGQVQEFSKGEVWGGGGGGGDRGCYFTIFGREFYTREIENLPKIGRPPPLNSLITVTWNPSPSPFLNPGSAPVRYLIKNEKRS